MARPLLILLAAFLVVSPSALRAQQQPCEKQYVVSRTELTGTRLPSAQQALVAAKLIGQCFDGEQLARLADEARKTLRGIGYWRASVTEPGMTIQDGGGYPQSVSIRFQVDEGARFKVREIDIRGNSAISAEEIRSVTQVDLENFLDVNAVTQTVLAIRRLYRANGYPNASVFSDIRASDGLGVSVGFTVIEKPNP
jgi:outer membrane protein assembly factor BamA